MTGQVVGRRKKKAGNRKRRAEEGKRREAGKEEHVGREDAEKRKGRARKGGRAEAETGRQQHEHRKRSWGKDERREKGLL